MNASGSREPRPTRATDLFSREEIKALTRPSDLAGVAAVASAWAPAAAAFALVARWPHPLAFAAAVVVLGGRQLALAIAMHEAAHGTLFRTRALNERAADWLCARPVFGDVARYRRHHLGHHAHTGTERDPDLGLAPAAPMTRASLARKVARDLSGVSGVRRVLGVALIDAELLAYDVGGGAPKRLPFRGAFAHARAFARNAGPALAANGALAAALALAGCAWGYAAWAVAYLTTYGLFLRVRSLAEHACTERGPDPLRNTRSTRAGLLARLTVAPLNVNLHLEHHLLPTVPWFRLPAMARLLARRGALPEGSTAGSYREVLALVSRG
jgi:fatty acid desaturase